MSTTPATATGTRTDGQIQRDVLSELQRRAHCPVPEDGWGSGVAAHPDIDLTRV